jgi:hypothetical protein
MDVRWELKNKKTGKLYWLTDQEMNDLKRIGIQNRYIISEIKPMAVIKDPLQIDIKKVKAEQKYKKSE